MVEFAEVAALVIFLLTLLAVITLLLFPLRFQPPWCSLPQLTVHYVWAPGLAVLLNLVCGSMSLDDVGQAIAGDDNIQPYGVVIMLLSAAYMAASLDATGAFAWLAMHAAHRSRGRGTKLLFLCFALSMGLTVLTSSDVVLVTLTPILCHCARATRADPVPFLVALFAAAHLGAMLLMVGSPASLVTGQALGLGFVGFTQWMWFPTLVSGAACVGGLFLHFRRRLARQVPPPAVPPAQLLTDRLGAVLGAANLLVCLATLCVASAVGWPLWPVPLACAAVQMLYNLAACYLWRKADGSCQLRARQLASSLPADYRACPATADEDMANGILTHESSFTSLIRPSNDPHSTSCSSLLGAGRRSMPYSRLHSGISDTPNGPITPHSITPHSNGPITPGGTCVPLDGIELRRTRSRGRPRSPTARPRSPAEQAGRSRSPAARPHSPDVTAACVAAHSGKAGDVRGTAAAAAAAAAVATAAASLSVANRRSDAAVDAAHGLDQVEGKGGLDPSACSASSSDAGGYASLGMDIWQAAPLVSPARGRAGGSSSSTGVVRGASFRTATAATAASPPSPSDAALRLSFDVAFASANGLDPSRPAQLDPQQVPPSSPLAPRVTIDDVIPSVPAPPCLLSTSMSSVSPRLAYGRGTDPPALSPQSPSAGSTDCSGGSTSYVLQDAATDVSPAAPSTAASPPSHHGITTLSLLTLPSGAAGDPPITPRRRSNTEPPPTSPSCGANGSPLSRLSRQTSALDSCTTSYWRPPPSPFAQHEGSTVMPFPSLLETLQLESGGDATSSSDAQSLQQQQEQQQQHEDARMSRRVDMQPFGSLLETSSAGSGHFERAAGHRGLFGSLPEPISEDAPLLTCSEPIIEKAPLSAGASAGDDGDATSHSIASSQLRDHCRAFAQASGGTGGGSTSPASAAADSASTGAPPPTAPPTVPPAAGPSAPASRGSAGGAAGVAAARATHPFDGFFAAALSEPTFEAFSAPPPAAAVGGAGRELVFRRPPLIKVPSQACRHLSFEAPGGPAALLHALELRSCSGRDELPSHPPPAYDSVSPRRFNGTLSLPASAFNSLSQQLSGIPLHLLTPHGTAIAATAKSLAGSSLVYGGSSMALNSAAGSGSLNGGTADGSSPPGAGRTERVSLMTADSSGNLMSLDASHRLPDVSHLLVPYRRRFGKTLTGLPWESVPFILGMFCLVYSLQVQGWVSQMATLLGSASSGSLAASIFVTGWVAVFLANGISAQPMAVLLTRVCLDPAFIAQLGDGAVAQQRVRGALLAIVVGGNLGASLTLVGSLVGVRWADAMQHAGIRMTYVRFVRMLLPCVALATLTALLVLWATFWMWEGLQDAE